MTVVHVQINGNFFFSVHKLAEFCKSYNLISSVSRHNFLILPTNPGGYVTFLVARPGPCFLVEIIKMLFTDLGQSQYWEKNCTLCHDLECGRGPQDLRHAFSQYRPPCQ